MLHVNWKQWRVERRFIMKKSATCDIQINYQQKYSQIGENEVRLGVLAMKIRRPHTI